MTVEDTKKAIQASYDAFQTYRHLTPAQRNAILLKLQRLFEEHAKDIARLIVWENGKSYSDAYTEALYAGSYVGWYAPEALRTNGETIPCSLPGTRNFTIKQPVGVCALLVP
jgi:succinate-semialdehyde dehydrogenase/glutarate-semialdehyde dehydrogenase